MMSFKPKVAAAALGLTAVFAYVAPLKSEPVSSAVSADPAVIEAGAKSFAANCGECHSINKDGRTVMGPNLWGVMGRKLGAVKDFGYSDALFNSNLVWSPETMDKWIESPSTFVPDNMMPYIGMKDPKERAAVIAYIAKRSTEDD
jgi:cytochrome c